MKSALILGTHFATTFAHGPEAGRRLPTWNLDGGLAGSATGGHQECHFRSTAALFDKTWGMHEESLHGDPLDGINFNEGGAYHSNKRVAPTDWQNTSHPILIARFDVDLTLNNYAAATQDANTKNYKYYDYYDPAGWTTTKLDATGKEKMTSICVKKSGHPTPTVCTDNGDIIVEVDDGGDAGQPGTGVSVQLGVRKTLGIATTCGVGAGGDVGGGLTSNAADIFVWGTLSAQQDLTFVLTRNNQGPDAHSLTTSGEASGPTPDEDEEDGLNYVSVSLAVTSPQPITHDLLFIEEHVTANNYLFSSHPGCNPDEAGKCQDDTEYRIDIQGPETDESTGGITINTGSTAMTCDVSLTVASGRPDQWHCFRDAASQYVPGSSHDSTDFATKDGDTVLAALSAVAAQKIGDGSCTAQLKVDCSSMSLTISGSDSRQCDFETGFGANAPQVDSGGTAGNNAAELARQAAYKSCVESAWFQDKSYFNGDIMLTGSYDAAIVQAVRLANTRQYPKDASNTAVDIVVGTSFGSVSSNWECTTNCAAEDPYKVLSSDTVSARSQFDQALTFVTQDVDNSKGASLNYKASSVGNGVAGGSGTTADHSITTTCTCSGHSTGASCCDDGPDYDSTATTLANPPAGFPESYVFGVVSFDFLGNDGDTKDYDLFIRPGGVEDQVPDSAGETQHTRRLLRSSAPRGVQRTLLVNAVQNVINK